jgi:hypothetical protein
MPEESSFFVDTGEANSLGGVGGRVVVVDMASFGNEGVKPFSWPSRELLVLGTVCCEGCLWTELRLGGLEVGVYGCIYDDGKRPGREVQDGVDGECYYVFNTDSYGQPLRLSINLACLDHRLLKFIEGKSLRASVTHANLTWLERILMWGVETWARNRSGGHLFRRQLLLAIHG